MRKLVGWVIVMLALWLGQGVVAETFSALARLNPAASAIRDDGDDLTIRLGLSQPVPWRVRVKDGPPRLLIDFREVDFAGLPEVSVPADKVAAMRAGTFRPGWSRLVLELTGPMLVSIAEMRTEGGTEVALRLKPASAAEFAVAAAAPEPLDWVLPEPVELPPPPKAPGGPLVVVLDPGHGGLDPGAEAEGQSEAKVVLNFALELRDLLRREGMEVVLTREEDVFVPLETRTSIARAAGADVFLALHADALPEGEAVGATVYTLAPEASDAAAKALAERHDRDDLLAGLDLSAQDDLVAAVLMDMARTETTPRTARLAKAMVGAIKAAGLKMHRHPHQEAGFSVLKSPDIPSILLELGFLSSERDRARLSDPEWRVKMAGAIKDALVLWAADEAARRVK